MFRSAKKESARHLVPLHRQVSVISTSSISERIHSLMRINSQSGYPNSKFESQLIFRNSAKTRSDSN